jgi:hypothetical protein
MEAPQALGSQFAPPAGGAAAVAEGRLVRRIIGRMGGQLAVKGLLDPAAVRQVVLEALAAGQATQRDTSRVLNNNLTAVERRAVRTVTNRGAAVRSRQRQRMQLSELQAELAAKDRQLETLQHALGTVHSVLGSLNAQDLVTAAAAAPPPAVESSQAQSHIPCPGSVDVAAPVSPMASPRQQDLLLSPCASPAPAGISSPVTPAAVRRRSFEAAAEPAEPAEPPFTLFISDEGHPGAEPDRSTPAVGTMFTACRLLDFSCGAAGGVDFPAFAGERDPDGPRDDRGLFDGSVDKNEDSLCELLGI